MCDPVIHTITFRLRWWAWYPCLAAVFFAPLVRLLPKWLRVRLVSWLVSLVEKGFQLVK